MIVYWRAHLNSIQNAVGYMIKPTMAVMFSGPSVPGRVELFAKQAKIKLHVNDAKTGLYAKVPKHKLFKV